MRAEIREVLESVAKRGMEAKRQQTGLPVVTWALTHNWRNSPLDLSNDFQPPRDPYDVQAAPTGEKSMKTNCDRTLKLTRVALRRRRGQDGAYRGEPSVCSFLPT
jgi:hypothetical protein